MWPVLLIGFVRFRSLARLIAVRTLPPERILVLGDAEAEQRLRHRIDTAYSIRGTVIGRMPLDPGEPHDREAMGPLADLDFVLRKHRVERVIIAPSSRTSDDLLNTIRVVQALGVKVSVLPRLFEVVGSSLEFDDIDGITILGLRRYGLTKTSWHVKRSFDLAVATTCLFLLAPLLAVIALAVRLSSPGPILFRQPRVGRRGEKFEMFKFRTMSDGADEDESMIDELNEAGGLCWITVDPLVSWVARLLRR